MGILWRGYQTKGSKTPALVGWKAIHLRKYGGGREH